MIDPNEELRYVVKLEVESVIEPVDAAEIDDERDHLMEIHEILENLGDAENECIGNEVYQRRRYDLCPACYRHFIKNPVGRDVAAQLGFSSN